MSSLLIATAAASGLVAIASDWRGQRQRLFYFAKPLTTVLIVVLAWVSLSALPQYRAWVMAALLCCLTGDIALMFKGTRPFVLGLAAFLIGHLLLIAAFVTGLPLTPLQVPLPPLVAGAAFLLLVAGYAAWLLPRTGKLKPAVLLYLSVLSLMVLAALLKSALGERAADDWVLLAALLFALSDAVLAYRKFVAAPWWGQPATLLSYYLAIGLIAWAH
ncbi:MAG: lysoplasmalogenase [Pseudomonadota bacterium]